MEALESRTLLTTVLSPAADSFIRGGVYADTNFGASPTLFVENASGSDGRVALLRFDLSGVGTISSAVLRATGMLKYPESSPVSVNVAGVLSNSWVEGNGTVNSRNGNGSDTDNQPAGEVTWNNAPSVDPGAITSTTVNRYGLQTYSWDLTPYIQSQMSGGSSVVSLALEAGASAQWVSFLSRESGGFGPQLVINGTGSPAPTATVNAPDQTDASMTNVPVSVTYSGELPIDPSTVNTGNISVSGPAGTLQVTNAALTQSASDGNSSQTVIYAVAAPSGGWTAADNGLYTVIVQPNQVRDTGGGAAISSEGQFRVAVDDSQPPNASISAADLTSATSSYSFTITYSDNVAIDPSWSDVDNVLVTAPDGTALKVLSAQADSTASGTPRTVTYTVAGAHGAWSATDNGKYTINLLPGQMRDTAGNPAAPVQANFQVNIASSSTDTTPPTATISAPAITSPGGSSEAITVTYSDDTAVDVTSINTGNLSVSGPTGPLTVTAVQVGATSNGSPITATYTVAAPGGSWQPSDDGAYTVTVQAGSVKDTSGNGVAATSANFTVNATQPDATPPSAQISAPNITSGGGSTQTITVVYTDDVAVNAASIRPANISVTGPGGPLTVTAAQASGPSGSPLTVTYTVAAPRGTWSNADNGSYVVALNANQVSDTAGNFAGGASGSFTINIPAPLNVGPPDMTFANGQTVATNFVTEAIAVQDDGRVIAVGHQGNLSAGQSQGVIERFNADGTLDTSFGANGMIVSHAGVNEAYFAVAMQDAAHFIIAGTSDGDFVLARYNINGTPDGSFGSGGRVVTDFGTTADAARSIALAPGGLIVVGGVSDGNFAFARYDSSGHLDPNFAQSGRQLYGLGSGSDDLGAIAVQSDGRIVAVGSEGAAVVVVRLTSSGEADGTFGSGGLVSVTPLVARQDTGAPDRSEGLALTAAGQILVANRTSTGHFGLVRLNPNGNLDTTFGTNGLAVANFAGDDDADSIVVQDSGPIIVVGTTLQNNNPQTAVAAFDPSGNPLTNFAKSGLLVLPSGIAPIARELHVGDIVLRAFGVRTSDGRVVIGTTDEAVAATTSSSLRRLIVPGAEVTAAANAGTLLGSFGIVNGHRKKLSFRDPNGTMITLTLTGGTGNAYLNGDRLTLIIDDMGRGVVLTITGRGGANRVSLADVTISGTLRAFNAPNSDLFGTLHVTGSIGTVRLGNISGTIWSGAAIGTVTAADFSGNLFATGAIGHLKLATISGTIASGAGVIGTVQASSMDNARILSGANLGADGAVGGTGADADSYGAGSIGSIKIKGAITSSFIGAGVNPVDQTFGNSDDQVVGGASSAIRLLSARSADQATRFEAGAFGRVLLPKMVHVLQDARFRVLA